MKYSMTETVMAVIAYAESHLSEKPDLEEVSAAVCYSKYYLHRMVTKTLGMTLHDYIRRRRLTEAARLLVCSQNPFLRLHWLQDMKASRLLQAFSNPCINRVL